MVSVPRPDFIHQKIGKRKTDMTEFEYKKIIQGFCECVGIEDWQEVVKTSHIQIGERTVGLLYDRNPSEKEALLLYIDLGAIYERDRLGLYQKMLEANLQTNPSQTGCFGIHPEIGHAVYYKRMEVHPSSDELARQVDALFSKVDRLFSELSADAAKPSKAQPPQAQATGSPRAMPESGVS